jgi:cytochrome c-type biogenesis protein CcmH
VFAFWVIAGLLVVVALLFVLPSLIGHRREAAPSRDELIRALHRQRLAELERDVKADVLTEAQYERARADLERELLAESAVSTMPAERSPRTRTSWTAWAVGLALPALATGFYLQFSTGLEALDGRAELAADAQEPPSIAAMAQLIEARLEQHPEDRTGWIMLARVNSLTGQHGKAARAYARADRLAALDEPGLLVAYAQSFALANRKQFAGKPTELLNAALARAPNNRQALWLAGWAAFQRGDFAEAVRLWERLQGQAPARGPFAQLPAQIAEARRLARQAPAGNNLVDGDDAGEAPASEKTGDRNAAAASIHAKVALAPTLKDRVSPEDTLFIYAQAVDGAPRVPLAIVRKTAAELPLDVALDDTMAMAPAFKLSSVAAVKVTARVSPTGDAMPRPGDLIGESEPVPTHGGAQVSITIDEVLP